MLLPYRLLAAGVSLGLAAGPVPAREDPSADLILHSGFVWTVDAQNSAAEAVAVREDEIVAVGANAEVLGRRGPETRLIDLEGRLVLPGFNDNHVHFASAAQFLEFNIMSVGTQEEFVERVQDVASRLPEEEWIVGGFWGAYDPWAAGSAGGRSRQPFTPEMARVEDLTRSHPVFIRKFDGSEFAVNRAALRAAGLDWDNPEAPGVEFVRGPDGKLTGILRGREVEALFAPHVPRRFSYQRRMAQSLRALAEIRKHGVTSISDMSDDLQLEIYEDLRQAGELTVRVHFRPQLEEWKKWAERDVKVGSGDAWIRLGSVKGHIDGIMGTKTARFFEPYSDDAANRGRWRRLMVDEQGEVAEGKFLQYILEADRAGLQLTVHAIGDEANHLLLDYLEELNRVNGRRDRRFRIVHAQVLAPGDFRRLGELGAVAEVQPFHLSDDMRWMEERIGRERCRGAYAFKTIQEVGAVLSFGTDWPGTSAAEYPINPMLGLYAAVTRQTVTGEPAGGWFPEERIGIRDAIRAYTYNTAYAHFEEDIKGSIEVGKLADLVVLSRNLLEIPPHEILDTKVVYTLVGGKIAYEEPAMPAAVGALIDDFPGRLYFSAKNLKTGEVLEYRGDERVQTASVIKVPIMVEVFAQAREHRLALADVIAYTEANRAPGAGILQDLGPGLQLTLRDAVVLMIVLSDNTATNMLIDRVGIDAVNERMRGLGLRHTFLNKKVFLPAPENLPPERAAYGLGVTTPREMLALLERLYLGGLVDAAACREMISILKRQRDRDQIPRYLTGPEWQGVEVAHKTGALNRVRNDAGIVFTPRGDVVLSLFAQESEDEKWTPDHKASLALGRLAEALLRHLLR